MTTAAESRVPPRLTVLGWDLLKLGAVAFGGLGSTLALLQRRLGDERGWLDQAVISEGLAFTRALPGSTGIQLVAYLSHRLCGWPGTLVGTLAYIAPATLLMILAAAFAIALPDHPAVDRAITGLQIGVVGLLAASMWRLVRSEAKDRARLAVLLVCTVLGFFVNAVLVVALAGTVGLLLTKEEKRHA
jgi:chromate transporter